MTRPSIFLVCVGCGAFVALGLKLAGKDKRSQEERRGWRVRCVVAGRWAYEEKHGGAWVGIEFEELGDHREEPHVVDVRSVDRWSDFPAWAVQKRSEIIARLKSEFAARHYALKENA